MLVSPCAVLRCVARCPLPTNHPGSGHGLHLVIPPQDAEPPPVLQVFLPPASRSSVFSFEFSQATVWHCYLTSDYFLTKLKSAKFAMTGMNLVTAGAVGKCVSADKTPHTPHLAQHNPYTAPDTAPEKNVGEKGQALRAGPSVHMNSGNHFHGSSAKQAIPYLLFLYRCLCY